MSISTQSTVSTPASYLKSLAVPSAQQSASDSLPDGSGDPVDSVSLSGEDEPSDHSTYSPSSFRGGMQMASNGACTQTLPFDSANSLQQEMMRNLSRDGKYLGTTGGGLGNPVRPCIGSI